MRPFTESMLRNAARALWATIRAPRNFRRGRFAVDHLVYAADARAWHADWAEWESWGHANMPSIRVRRTGRGRFAVRVEDGAFGYPTEWEPITLATERRDMYAILGELHDRFIDAVPY